jgi:hypothetical protein
MAGHQRTADTPADGGRADTPTGGGQADTGGGAILRIGIHAYAMGKEGYGWIPNVEAGKGVSTAQAQAQVLRVCVERYSALQAFRHDREVRGLVHSDLWSHIRTCEGAVAST